MKSRSRFWLVGPLMAVLFSNWIDGATPLCWASPSSSESSGSRITIWIYNYAHVPDRTLCQGEKELAGILEQAEVRVDWVSCPSRPEEIRADSPCQERMEADEVALTIAPHAERSATAPSDTYLGSAQIFTNGQFGHYAYVYFDRVMETAHRMSASLPDVLACVAAHEIGHLLLRSAAHATQGLMGARWDSSDLHLAAWGRLGFTAQQAKRIQAGLAQSSRGRQLSQASGLSFFRLQISGE
jgi:hypothetical protein